MKNIQAFLMNIYHEHTVEKFYEVIPLPSITYDIQIFLLKNFAKTWIIIQLKLYIIKK